MLYVRGVSERTACGQIIELVQKQRSKDVELKETIKERERDERSKNIRATYGVFEGIAYKYLTKYPPS
jgi:hypothetical protein